MNILMDSRPHRREARAQSQRARFKPLMLGICLLSAFSVPVQANDQAELDALKQEIADLKKWLNQAAEDKDNLVSGIQATDKDISELSKKVEQTRRLLEEEQARLKKLQRDQLQLTELQSRYRAQLTQQIQAAHRMGNDSPIKLLLSQENPQQAQRMMTYFGYFNRARTEQISTTIEELDQLENIKETIQAQQRTLESTHQQLARESEQLNRQRKKQQTLLVQLQHRIDSSQQTLSTKEADRDRLERLLQEVRTLVAKREQNATASDGRPFSQLKGKLQSPVKGRIKAAWGKPIKDGVGKWEGWLIHAPENTEVKAVHQGQVVYSDWLNGFGMLVLIDHGQDYLSLYAHNQALYYEVGSWVYQGDTVATVGRSGGLEQTGLYFEIRHKGIPLDPAAWLKR